MRIASQVRRLHGGNSPMQLILQGEKELQNGSFEKAATLFRSAADMTRSGGTTSTSHVHVQALNRLGVAQAELNQNAEAETSFKEALSAARQMRDEALVCASTVNVASILSRQGQHSEALLQLQEAQNLRTKLSTPNSHESIDLALDVAQVLMQLGRFEEADKAIEDALLLLDAGTDSETAQELRKSALEKKVDFLTRIPDADASLLKATADKLLPLSEKLCGANSEDHSEVLKRVATAFAVRKMTKDLIPILEKIKDVTKALRGTLDPAMVPVLHNLALSNMSLGQHDAAEPHLLEALRISEAKHGQNNARNGQTVYYLSQLYTSKKDFKKAELQLKRLLHLYKQQEGQDQAEFLAQIHHQLAIVSTAQNLANQADYYYRLALDLLKDKETDTAKALKRQIEDVLPKKKKD